MTGFCPILQGTTDWSSDQSTGPMLSVGWSIVDFFLSEAPGTAEPSVAYVHKQSAERLWPVDWSTKDSRLSSQQLAQFLCYLHFELSFASKLLASFLAAIMHPFEHQYRSNTHVFLKLKHKLIKLLDINDTYTPMRGCI